MDTRNADATDAARARWHDLIVMEPCAYAAARERLLRRAPAAAVPVLAAAAEEACLLDEAGARRAARRCARLAAAIEVPAQVLCWVGVSVAAATPWLLAGLAPDAHAFATVALAILGPLAAIAAVFIPDEEDHGRPTRSAADADTGAGIAATLRERCAPIPLDAAALLLLATVLSWVWSIAVSKGPAIAAVFLATGVLLPWQLHAVAQARRAASDLRVRTHLDRLRQRALARATTAGD